MTSFTSSSTKVPTSVLVLVFAPTYLGHVPYSAISSPLTLTFFSVCTFVLLETGIVCFSFVQLISIPTSRFFLHSFWICSCHHIGFLSFFLIFLGTKCQCPLQLNTSSYHNNYHVHYHNKTVSNMSYQYKNNIESNNPRVW